MGKLLRFFSLVGTVLVLILFSGCTELNGTKIQGLRPLNHPISKQKIAENKESPQNAVQAILTAYTHSEGGHRRYGKKTAVGTTLRAHGPLRSAAADWSFLPLGTIFKYKGESFKIEDYGKALVGTKKVDIYMPTMMSMQNFGIKRRTIEIIKLGSFSKSAEILKNRRSHNHVRKMHDKIKGKL